jgi:hypothetical protein
MKEKIISKTIAFGRIVKCYTLPLEVIDELNQRYEIEKQKLHSFGPRLAGRLDTELEFTNFLHLTKASTYIADFMHDYYDTLDKIGLLPKTYSLEIISCWINDMKEGEYNPPHTHHDLTGFSTVMFLKVPEFVNDVKDPHKFKDGYLGFTTVDGIGTVWIEPKVGEFYIFEAKHQHCVLPFKVKNKGDIRRSMSFNFIEKVSENNV